MAHAPTEATKPKRFRLSLVNAAEDVPRLVRAYGRACMGEFALVLRPREQRGVLVLMTKKDGARVWRAGDAPPSDQVRAFARVEGKRLRIETGPHAGVSFHAMNTDVERAIRGREGEQVEVRFVPDDQFAELAGPLEAGDAPGIPSSAIAPDDAVKLVKAEQKGLAKAGPITLRGQWSGWLYCDEGAPRVELSRKLATYGVLHLTSVAGKGWAWKVARTEKWFSQPGADEGRAPTLLGAIEAGLRRAMGLLGEACSLRDSRRRAAYDSSYAAEHPVKPAREGKDPTERIKVRPVKASGWTHFLHDDEAPEAEEIGKPTKAQRTMLAAAGLELDPEAGTFFGRTTEAWSGYPAGSLVYRDAHDNGFHIGPVSKGGGRRKAAPPAPVDAPLALPDVPETSAALQRMADQVTVEADALAELRSRRWVWDEADTAAEVQAWFAQNGLDHEAGEVAAFIGNPWDGATFLADLRRSVETEAPDTKRAALAQIDRLETWWTEAPQLMARARKLIRYAARMAESKLCKGKEKREAVEAVQRAVQAYDEARAAIQAGKPVDGVLTLRRIGERVALSAAKSARSCAGGQQSLTAGVGEAPATPAPKRVVPSKPAPKRATPKPAAKPVRVAATAEPAVDAAKDKALLDAFSAAIAAAMQGAA